MTFEATEIDLPMIGGFTPSCARSHDAALRTQDLLARDGADAFSRQNLPGHITASAFVVSPDAQQTLLIHHRKLDLWLQPGGHCDGDQDVLGVACRELSEETGLTDWQVASPRIFDVDVHPIPETPRDVAHFHHDIRYLVIADPAAPLIQNHETLALRWVPMDALERYTDKASVLVVRRAIDRLRS